MIEPTHAVEPAPLAINPDRLWDRLQRAAEVGRWRSVGVQRLALTDADRSIRDLYCSWCREAGLTIRVDRVGNIFARHAGEGGGPPVMLGSHLDSQVAGGRYDGTLGVLAALEVVQSIGEQRIETRHPVEVVAWTNEEGARFSPPMFGSAAFTGALSLSDALAVTDVDGVAFGAELERIGYAGDDPVPGQPPVAYVELHIEQGDLLDVAGIDLGLVTHAYPTRGVVVRFTGETAHSGATPMCKRRNALVAAARACAAIDDLAARSGDEARTTTSQFHAWPNRPGIVSSDATITVDVRHPDRATADRMRAETGAIVRQAAARHGVRVSSEKEWTFGDEVVFDPHLRALVRSTAERLGVATLDLASSAGHDAYWLSTVAPTAILFAPCKDGITHNEREDVEFRRVLPAVNVLAHTILRTANLPQPPAHPT